MNVDITIKSLTKKGYEVSYFEKAIDAASYLDKKIDKTTVGFGDSHTLVQLKMFEMLALHNIVYDPQCCAAEEFLDVAKKSMDTNVFLTSVNAMAETGELVNIDGSGNRVAGSSFGHQKVYFVVSVNKIMPTLEEAIWRARNIAAPRNAMRLGLKTPCAKNGTRCFDCSSADRICNGLMIYLNKMSDMDIEVVIINETLGF